MYYSLPKLRARAQPGFVRPARTVPHSKHFWSHHGKQQSKLEHMSGRSLQLFFCVDSRETLIIIHHTILKQQ